MVDEDTVKGPELFGYIVLTSEDVVLEITRRADEVKLENSRGDMVGIKSARLVTFTMPAWTFFYSPTGTKFILVHPELVKRVREEIDGGRDPDLVWRDFQTWRL